MVDRAHHEPAPLQRSLTGPAHPITLTHRFGGQALSRTTPPTGPAHPITLTPDSVARRYLVQHRRPPAHPITLTHRFGGQALFRGRRGPEGVTPDHVSPRTVAASLTGPDEGYGDERSRQRHQPIDPAPGAAGTRPSPLPLAHGLPRLRGDGSDPGHRGDRGRRVPPDPEPRPREPHRGSAPGALPGRLGSGGHGGGPPRPGPGARRLDRPPPGPVHRPGRRRRARRSRRGAHRRHAGADRGRHVRVPRGGGLGPRSRHRRRPRGRQRDPHQRRDGGLHRRSRPRRCPAGGGDPHPGARRQRRRLRAGGSLPASGGASPGAHARG